MERKLQESPPFLLKDISNSESESTKNRFFMPSKINPTPKSENPTPKSYKFQDSSFNFKTHKSLNPNPNSESETEQSRFLMASKINPTPKSGKCQYPDSETSQLRFFMDSKTNPVHNSGISSHKCQNLDFGSSQSRFFMDSEINPVHNSENPTPKSQNPCSKTSKSRVFMGSKINPTSQFETPKSKNPNSDSETSQFRFFMASKKNPYSETSQTASKINPSSHFETPKTRKTMRNSQYESPYSQFFTASKQTPLSSSVPRNRLPSTSARSKVARRLKGFELEQMKSARKVQIEKEKSLKSLSKALTVWLNFLLKKPEFCGCDLSKMIGEGVSEAVVKRMGKRESMGGGGVRVDATWRCPKRQKGQSWRGVRREEEVGFSGLESSLREVCSFDDLKERMNYVGFGSSDEIFGVMAQVTKTIDEGRLQMKAHCPIVTDVGMKEKASSILMSYNPTWLRIGLYIIFGGESLLPEGETNSEEDIAFLKMVIDKQFFSHAGLAKTFAYNKLVEGLYRPGYYEALGNIILKRILLLVLILDRAKSQSCLPIKYGIDGLDGGSPLLFTLQSNIKTSSQVIHDFLSTDVMHGEGNVLAHLVIIGYKVSYQQSPLNEYDFKVMDLFEDIRDGVRLCRVVQLLQHDTSLLMTMVVPSDTHKKNLVNCGIALKSLKEAGIPLCDEDGMVIEEEDIVSGDKELTLSLLWNVFVHMQLPLLINKTLLLDEISRIQGVNEECSENLALLDMLLKWIQAICDTYGCKVENFASLVDGKAMWCLLDYYFRKELKCSCSDKDLKETSIMSVSDYTDAVHNFLLSQKLTTLLGNFPEVLEVSDVLENNGASSSKSVIVLLVFLSFQLIVKKNTDQLNFHKILGFVCQTPARKSSSTAGKKDFKAIMAWWKDMALQNKRFNPQPIPISSYLSSGRDDNELGRENGATIIQSYFRKSMERKRYLQERNAVIFLQAVIRAWLSRKKLQAEDLETRKQLQVLRRYALFIGDRRKFVKLRRSVTLIQHVVRHWISQRRHRKSTILQNIYACEDHVEQASSNGQAEVENAIQIKAISTVQIAWRKVLACKILHQQQLAATKIQCCYRGRFLRKNFLRQKQATIKIQSAFRCLKCLRSFQRYKEATRLAVVIQSHMRGWIARRGMHRLKRLIIIIQSSWRAYSTRRDFLVQKEAVIKIQSAFRSTTYSKNFHDYREGATDIQRFIRGQLARRRILGASLRCCIRSGSISQVGLHSPIVIFVKSVVKLQRWWRDILMKKSAIVIQSHIRGSIARRHAKRERLSIIMIQRWWRRILQQETRVRSAVTVQSYTRRWLARREAIRERHHIIEIQRWWRGVIMQKVRMRSAIVIQSYTRRWLSEREAIRVRQSLMRNRRIRSAIIIQSYTRRWLVRRKAIRERHLITVIQSCWKGYLARRDLRGQLLDLRFRIRESAANVDDSMRIMNRLLVALSDLLNMRSLTGILQTCKILDMATQHSQKCCEKLVEAGAIDTLLKLIRSVSRSIPDQEVLKHALSTLRNLARYSHLVEELISNPVSVATIFMEFLRNKEEGYFVACELLKKICSNRKGIQVVKNSPALLKRLNILVEDLKRQAGNENRKVRGVQAREQLQRRLREAAELLKLITSC